MTRKHFSAIASVLAGELAVARTDTDRFKVRAIACMLADQFAGFNPNFNRSRFYVASGLTATGELAGRD